jgi:CheY-like chemotaxis protein
VTNDRVLAAWILVAEDYAIARASLAELLHYAGYRVYEAGNRDAAIASIDQNSDIAVLLPTSICRVGN